MPNKCFYGKQNEEKNIKIHKTDDILFCFCNLIHMYCKNPINRKEITTTTKSMGKNKQKKKKKYIKKMRKLNTAVASNKNEMRVLNVF